MKPFALMPLILVFCLMALPLEAQENQWLGAYAGGEVPGFEITGSRILFTRIQGGPTGDFSEEKLLSELIAYCKKGDFGKALANVRFVVSLGEVSFPEKGASIKIISPAIYALAYGDCVTSLRSKTKK